MKLELIPTKYEVRYGSYSYYIEQRGPYAWAICDFGNVLGHDLEWEMEMQPSSRSSEFIARTRYPTPHAALTVLERYLDISISGAV